MAASYDRIAPVYDMLSRIVFGRTLERAQEALLRCIPPRSTILIIGGGTGWALERITTIYREGLVIDYVESSAEMLQLSRGRDYGGNEVNFIHQSVEEFITDTKYDIIITAFFFDNFRPDRATMIFDKLAAMQSAASLWLYTDYIITPISPIWQRVLLKTMYTFFRITSGIEASSLPDMDSLFAKGHVPVFQKYFYRDFIRSTAYRRI